MVSSYQSARFHTHKYGSIHGTCLLLASSNEWEDPVQRLIPEVKIKRKVSGKLFLLYIANYNLLNIDRVICKVEIREGREAGTIHRWFTGALLLG